VLHYPSLSAIRTVLVQRIDDAAVAAQRLASPDVSMPSSLLAACMWLADAGYDGEASEGEKFFAWSPAAYLRYLYGLSPVARAQEVAAGRRVLFEGRGRRPALIQPVAEMAVAA
jgi:hypothetical protein